MIHRLEFYRLEINGSKEKHYKGLFNLCLDNPKLGVSKKTLKRYSFKEPYIADNFTITKLKVKSPSKLLRIARQYYIYKWSMAINQEFGKDRKKKRK